MSDVQADYFDLRSRPWIPVRTADGARAVGLRELFLDAHRVESLAVGLPPAASGLLRILCAMAARLSGLDALSDSTVWLDRRYELLQAARGFEPSVVEEYFAEHGGRLRLHDPVRPFLQDPRLDEQCAGRSGVNKLVMARPAGNNQVFFGHFTDGEQVPLPSSEAALHLIAQMYYGPSGQCTPRTVDGQRFGNTYAGPLRRALSYHPVGRSLYESLLLGIPAPGTWQQASGGPDADRCPWERDELPDPLTPPDGAVGPRSLLTQRFQHAVLLYPGEDGQSVVDATMTWAFRSVRPPDADPFLVWDEGRDGTLRPRDAQAKRSLWRDLDSLVLLHRGDGGRRPAVLDKLAGQLPDEVMRAVRVVAYGFDQDGQTRDRTYFTAATPELFTLLDASADRQDNALARGAKDARVAAEKAASRLAYALGSAWRAYTTPFGDDRLARTAGDAPARTGKAGKSGGPWPKQALARYWPAAEERFWALLDAGDFSGVQGTFGRIALTTYDEITRPVASTPRGAKARESARGLVRSLLDPDRRT
ncbi:type I-E CRISPR-associated protein Cse1/CasA [Streptomyces sp. CMB-StM0423]|uniref:type I-E CRISPR-associated protein Cse1/CasA n=1 Tax=Streptomyces sp. CMB-StM0423 TaxID=2059884 RepID=UPI000C710652|nr:type I-E CRISPR-associated protein Cse1/CasA [Streptomyces sp. CMB-StM0423]AUH40559.1 type I-E CRISPR-associated protein Cse1/CasA [Streptomyces sp. CMB-StM0423]